MKNLLALAILFVIFLIYYIFRAFRQYKRQTKQKSDRPVISTTWEKITVNTEQCEVVSREYYEEHEIDDSPTITKLLDSINAKPTPKKLGVSVVLYRHKFSDGTEYVFKSEPIIADDVSVRYMLMNMKVLSVYVDPLNRNNYTFKL